MPTQRKCTGREGRTCNKFMSNTEVDGHLLCQLCRGKSCTQDDTCEECSTWTKEQWKRYNSRKTYQVRKDRKTASESSSSISMPNLSLQVSPKFSKQDSKKEKQSVSSDSSPIPLNSSTHSMFIPDTPRSNALRTEFSSQMDALRQENQRSIQQLIHITSRFLPSPSPKTMDPLGSGLFKTPPAVRSTALLTVGEQSGSNDPKLMKPQSSRLDSPIKTARRPAELMEFDASDFVNIYVEEDVLEQETESSKSPISKPKNLVSSPGKRSLSSREDSSHRKSISSPIKPPFTENKVSNRSPSKNRTSPRALSSRSSRTRHSTPIRSSSLEIVDSSSRPSSHYRERNVSPSRHGSQDRYSYKDRREFYYPQRDKYQYELPVSQREHDYYRRYGATIQKFTGRVRGVSPSRHRDTDRYRRSSPSRTRETDRYRRESPVRPRETDRYRNYSPSDYLFRTGSSTEIRSPARSTSISTSQQRENDGKKRYRSRSPRNTKDNRSNSPRQPRSRKRQSDAKDVGSEDIQQNVEVRINTLRSPTKHSVTFKEMNVISNDNVDEKQDEENQEIIITRRDLESALTNLQNSEAVQDNFVQEEMDIQEDDELQKDNRMIQIGFPSDETIPEFVSTSETQESSYIDVLTWIQEQFPDTVTPVELSKSSGSLVESLFGQSKPSSILPSLPWSKGCLDASIEADSIMAGTSSSKRTGLGPLKMGKQLPCPDFNYRYYKIQSMENIQPVQVNRSIEDLLSTKDKE